MNEVVSMLLGAMLLGAALLGAMLVAGWGGLACVRRQRVHRRRANKRFMAGYKAGYRAGGRAIRTNYRP